MTYRNDMHLIITVVKKGWGDVVLSAMANIGVIGGTVLTGYGRASAQGLLGMALSPEKDVVLTSVGTDILEEAMRAAIEAGELRSSDVGICMSFPLTSAFLASSVGPDDGAAKDVPAAAGPADEQPPQ
jgi:hypothetical protein